MTTRSLICVVHKERFVVAQYSEFDGYPEGQGEKILHFLLYPGNIQHLRVGIDLVFTPKNEELEKALKKVEKWDQEALDHARAREEFLDTCSFGKSALSLTWPSLSPEAGARILPLIAQIHLEPQRKQRVPVVSDLGFANDDLFCEWAYVVDLDRDVFEVFGGWIKKADSVCTRFNSVGGSRDTVPKLIKSFDLFNLPAGAAEFHEALDP